MNGFQARSYEKERKEERTVRKHGMCCTFSARAGLRGKKFDALRLMKCGTFRHCPVQGPSPLGAGFILRIYHRITVSAYDGITRGTHGFFYRAAEHVEAYRSGRVRLCKVSFNGYVVTTTWLTTGNHRNEISYKWCFFCYYVARTRGASDVTRRKGDHSSSGGGGGTRVGQHVGRRLDGNHYLASLGARLAPGMYSVVTLFTREWEPAGDPCE
uniref:Uncharacterized protein TCIL3000_11_3200 n=1 Tax=Trypanosoma congolense (strain IL3000) TaxID=1068625 RepID=G0UZV3_TRYCI|nr:unnamed protein product [Trypanosoma congolense IL3000]